MHGHWTLWNETDNRFCWFEWFSLWQQLPQLPCSEGSIHFGSIKLILKYMYLCMQSIELKELSFLFNDWGKKKHINKKETSHDDREAYKAF